MTDRPHHRPSMPGAGRFEAIETTAHGADPAVLAEAAERAATALVRGARDQADSDLVSRVVHLADTEGLETLADLWAGAAPDSLAGVLWRLYVLRAWVYADPQTAAREFDRGRALAPVAEAISGVPWSIPSYPESWSAISRTRCSGPRHSPGWPRPDGLHPRPRRSRRTTATWRRHGC